MKFVYTLAFLLVFLSVNHAIAQTRVESDYVYEGKTIEYTLPKGFKEAFYEDEPLIKLYLLDTTGFHEAAMDYFLDTVPFDKGIVHGYVNKEENGYSLEVLVENLQSIIDQEFGEFILIREDPKYAVKNDLPFATVKCKYPDFEFEMNEFKICAVEFGDFYFFFITFHSQQSDNKLMDYLFDELINSIQVISTTKENTLLTWESVWRASQNAGVNTNIDEGKIHFKKESSSYWESWTDSDFLLYYDYGAPDAQIQGSIRVLSAGIESAEMTDAELKNYLLESDLNFPVEDIRLIGKVKGESKEFQKYAITGSKDVLQLYTTKLDGELLLIFAIRAAYTTSAFNKYYESFVRSMYIED